jgi:hypothetical protein
MTFNAAPCRAVCAPAALAAAPAPGGALAVPAAPARGGALAVPAAPFRGCGLAAPAPARAAARRPLARWRR